MDLKSSNSNWKIYLSLWAACLVGAWSVLPYISYLGLIPPEAPLIKIFVVATFQTAILYSLVLWLASIILPKTDLTPFAADRPFKRIVLPGAVFGIILGAAIFLLDHTIFQSSLLTGAHPPLWAGALASIYGAVNEEVLLRLFLFSLVYFLFIKVFKFRSDKKIVFLWATNAIVAVVFGLGHLPTALQLAPPSFFEISRILLLNGLPGLVFGWLYWSQGLWTAMAAHFVTDLMIHVFLI